MASSQTPTGANIIMRRTTPFFMFACTVVLAAASVGCAAETGDVSETDEAIAQTTLRNVGAFEIAPGRTLAAPAKVKKLMDAMTSAKEGTVRCTPAKTINILGTNKLKIGTLGLMCSPTEKSGKVTGVLELKTSDGAQKPGFGSRKYIVGFNLDVLTAVDKEPLSIGDLLFSSTKVSVSKERYGQGANTYTDPARVASIIASLRADQIPDLAARDPKVYADYTVTFFNGSTKIADVESNCDGTARYKSTLQKINAGLTKIQGLLCLDSSYDPYYDPYYDK